MATLIRDTFTGANGTLLESHIGETGAGWTWEAGWGRVPSSFEIRNNRLMLVASAASRDELYSASGQISLDDWTLEVGFVADGNAYQYAGVLTGDTIYGGGYKKLIEIRSDPVTSSVKFNSFGAVFDAPGGAWDIGREYIIKVEAAGSDLSYYVDGILIGVETVAHAQRPLLSVNMGRGSGTAAQLGLTFLHVQSATNPAFWTSNIGTTET